MISVIVPAYGRPAYLRELLTSVISDDSVAMEVIVIDDGSPTPVEFALDRFPASAALRVVRQENAGTATARNHGASLARGEYLLFIDDDDLVPAGSLQWRAQYLATHLTCVAVSGRCGFLHSDGQVDVEPVRWHGEMSRWDILIHNRFYSPGQLLVRRSAFERTRGFPVDRIGSDDWALWIDLTRFGQIHMDERISLSYRLHDGNFSRNVATMVRGAEDVVDDAVRTLCPAHAAVGDFLATQFVRDVYASKLAAVAAEARVRHDWSTVSTIAGTTLRLRQRLFSARLAQKLAIMTRHGRLRMRATELERLGRDCALCAGTARTATPTMRERQAAQVVA